MQQRQAVQSWTFVTEADYCSLHHRESGTIIELGKVPGAFFHFRVRGKGILCEENGNLRENRSLRSQKAAAILAEGKGAIFKTEWEWQDWRMIDEETQVAIYRLQKHGEKMPLTEVVHFVDQKVDIRMIGMIKIAPMLVLDSEGFSFIGTRGYCISVQQGILNKHGTQHFSRVEEMYMNSTLLDRVKIKRQLVAHFIKPWTLPFIESYQIEWDEWDKLVTGSDEELLRLILHRKTNPALLVMQMREQVSKRNCTTGFFSSSDTYFRSAQQIHQGYLCHCARQELRHRLDVARLEIRRIEGACRLQNAYLCHRARLERKFQENKKAQRLVERQRANAAIKLQDAWICHRARQEPLVLLPGCAPLDCKTYCFFVGAAPKQAAVMEQQGPQQKAHGVLGAGLYLHANVTAARESSYNRESSYKLVKGVVLEARVNVGKVCHVDSNPHLVAAHFSTEAPPWQRAGYDCAWQKNDGILCVWDARRVEIVQRVDWQSEDEWCGRFRWFCTSDSTGDGNPPRMVPLSAFDNMLLESHLRAWDEGKGPGNQCVQLILRTAFRCDWTSTSRGHQQISKTKNCTRWACWGHKNQAASRCRHHKNDTVLCGIAYRSMACSNAALSY